MKHRFLALGLSLCLLTGLAACGGGNGGDGDATPTPDPSQAVTDAPAGTLEPSATPIPDKGTPAPSDEVTAQPSQTPPTGSAEPTAQPTPTPAIGDPTVPPSVEPTAEPEPSDTPSIAVLAASTVYDTVSKSAGETTATMDASSVMENFYNLSAGDLEDFVLYMPDLSAYTEEIFIARAKAGKLDTVKAACQSRLDGLKEDGAFYPGTAIYLDSAKVVTQGDWVMLCICPDVSGAVSAFQSAVK